VRVQNPRITVYLPPQGIGPNAGTLLQILPIEDAKKFMLEPGTASRIQAMVALKRGPLYEATARIEIDKGQEDASALVASFDPDIFGGHDVVFLIPNQPAVGMRKVTKRGVATDSRGPPATVLICLTRERTELE
jgi:hypothetical protein